VPEPSSLGLLLTAALAGEVGLVMVRTVHTGMPAGFSVATRDMAHVLFSAQYLYVFEATSILILAALLGAVALAKKDI